MPMTLSGPSTVQLAAIKQVTFVRTVLNQEHVLYLADLYDNEVKIPPIIVNDQMELVEGRHRLEAMLLLGWKETKALIAKSLSPSDTLVEALAANMKGNLPPNQKDIEYVIQQLVALGTPTAKVSELLKHVLPATLIRKYVTVVYQRQERKRATEAVDDILEHGLTVEAAAKKHHIAPNILRDALGLRKKKAKPAMHQISAAIETRVRGLGQQISASSRELMEAYNDGIIGTKELNEFVQRIKNSTARLKRHATNVEERMESIKGGGSSENTGEEQ